MYLGDLLKITHGDLRGMLNFISNRACYLYELQYVFPFDKGEDENVLILMKTNYDMPILELETPEAKYRNNMVRDCHFSIDCACGGKDGKYSGSHFKDANVFFNKIVDDYEPLNENKFKHTFMLNERILLYQLSNEHNEKKKQSPLIIVCNDCEREFSFTQGSFLDLMDKMRLEYNQQMK